MTSAQTDIKSKSKKKTFKITHGPAPTTHQNVYVQQTRVKTHRVNISLGSVALSPS